MSSKCPRTALRNVTSSKCPRNVLEMSSECPRTVLEPRCATQRPRNVLELSLNCPPTVLRNVTLRNVTSSNCPRVTSRPRNVLEMSSNCPRAVLQVSTVRGHFDDVTRRSAVPGQNIYPGQLNTLRYDYDIAEHDAITSWRDSHCCTWS